MTQTTTPHQPAPRGRSRSGQPQPPGASGGPDLRAAAPAGPSGRRSAARVRDRRRAAVRRAFSGTPGRLRLAGIGAVLACLVLSLLGWAAFSMRGNALADARADAAQLIRVQEIATQLVKADSKFTNGALAYGREPANQLAEYDRAISEASALIAEASGANAQDAVALAAVNDDLTEYTARVASARATNRQAFQVSTGYLRQANDLLRGNADIRVAGMLPTLQELIDENGRRVEDAYSSSRRATWLLVGTALLALGGLVAVQYWLAHQTHRYANLPLLAASLAVLLVLGVGTFVMASAQGSANRVYDTSYRALRDLANARIQAYTAKSAESISLIYLGNGGAYQAAQDQYTKASAVARERLEAVPSSIGGGLGTKQLADWDAVHKQVYGRAGTDWVAAAAEASAEPKSGNLNGTFEQLDTVTNDALEKQATAVDSGLTVGQVGLRLIGWLAVVVGVIAAAFAWAGISQRLEEYR